MEVRTTFTEVQKRWPGVVCETSDRYKTQPPNWNWYYQVGYFIPTQAQVRRLGKRPRTRVRNFLKKNSIGLYIVGRVGGGEVFRHTLCRDRSHPHTGLLGMIPDHILEAFVAAEEARYERWPNYPLHVGTPCP